MTELLMLSSDPLAALDQLKRILLETALLNVRGFLTDAETGEIAGHLIAAIDRLRQKIKAAEPKEAE